MTEMHPEHDRHGYASGVIYHPDRTGHDLPPTPTEIPKWTCETPPSVFLVSLNGFDEIAVAARFGAPILALRDDPIAGGRALAFVHQRRLGSTDAVAYTYAMTLTMQEVMDYFHPEPKADPASAEGNAPTN